mmetsp:Transcript_108708/g.307468  ORF Transcript_108708/g.307468 Transcript_108708/m.307468 type:complete len:214 (+) Transcript_108708:571-1212(+)
MPSMKKHADCRRVGPSKCQSVTKCRASRSSCSGCVASTSNSCSFAPARAQTATVTMTSPRATRGTDAGTGDRSGATLTSTVSSTRCRPVYRDNSLSVQRLWGVPPTELTFAMNLMLRLNTDLPRWRSRLDDAVSARLRRASRISAIVCIGASLSMSVSTVSTDADGAAAVGLVVPAWQSPPPAATRLRFRGLETHAVTGSWSRPTRLPAASIR